MRDAARDEQVQPDAPGDGSIQKQDKQLPGDVAPPKKDVALPDLGPMPDAPCIPSCAGKTCGDPDGCGGICLPGTSCACDNAYGPVCGVNQITYWNACLLQKAGVPLSGTGECQGGAICYITIAPKCPSGTTCVTLYLTSMACLGSVDGLGTCWVLPPVCPSAPAVWRKGCDVAGPGPCLERCAASKLGEWFVHDSANCP